MLHFASYKELPREHSTTSHRRAGGLALARRFVGLACREQTLFSLTSPGWHTSRPITRCHRLFRMQCRRVVQPTFRSVLR